IAEPTQRRIKRGVPSESVAYWKYEGGRGFCVPGAPPEDGGGLPSNRRTSVSLSIAAIAGIRELDPSLYGGPRDLTRRLSDALRISRITASTMEGLPARAALLHLDWSVSPLKKGATPYRGDKCCKFAGCVLACVALSSAKRFVPWRSFPKSISTYCSGRRRLRIWLPSCPMDRRR